MLKILHLCLGNYFMDGYTYQENLLTRFHKRMGYEVEVIASTEGFDKDGKTCFDLTPGEYVNEDGIKIIRLQYSFPQKLNHKLRYYNGVYNAIVKSAPDIIFIHNCQFVSIYAVVKYLKKNNVRVFVDNHGDFSNSAKNIISKNIVHKIIWKNCAKVVEPFATKFFGVLPARVDFLTDIYGLPKEKCELLVMGADDDKVHTVCESNVREEKRKEYGVKKGDILIVTGGKIDLFKKQTMLLMKAVNEMPTERITLCIFGSVVPEIKSEFEALISDKVKYVGWKSADETYGEIAACDFAVFPGRHSVFWEQVAGMGIPMICKKWAGTTHIDIGGNVIFLENDSVEEMKTAITKMIENYDDYKRVAESGKEQFWYSNIAKRSIGL